MKIFKFLMLGIILVPASALAQDDSMSVGSSTSSLQDVLSNLKQSADSLSTDNDQLAARDKYITGEIYQLQMQLGGLQTQGEVLEKSVHKLESGNSRRAREITRLEGENYEMDNRSQKDDASIKTVQESLNAGYQEDEKLLLQLKNMSNVLPAAEGLSGESEAAVKFQKEKLKLIKMIFESQQRQAGLQASILEAQKTTPLLPAASALAHQQILKNQIKDLQDDLIGYPSEKTSAPALAPASSGPWGDEQLRELGDELKALEKNYAQLKNLVGQMGQRAKDFQMTASEHVDEEKLQASLDQVGRQGEGLRAKLDDLRSQMVDLDKRKSRLETMVQQLP